MSERARMEALVAQLNAAAYAYEQKNESILSDFEYDKLYDELKTLEAALGFALPNSPTVNVGYETVSGLEKVRHERPMLSLDKTKETERLAAFLEERTGLLSWKLDGLTIVLTYREGRLHRAVTRGNGQIGEDITHNARVFANLPKEIAFAGELVLRGEAVISFTEFERINSALEGAEKYKNPRNLCSGSVRQLNSEIAARRNVSFFAFSLIQAEGKGLGERKSDGLMWLEGLGFAVASYEVVTQASVAEAVAAFKRRIPENNFASDGLVLTYDDIAYSESLGVTSKFPKDSIAFKWADETGETVLKEIQWSTSRTGLINPIAVFEAVELEGTSVEKASLHNISVVESLALGVGDVITVYKANMIIPQVAENLTRSGTAVPPSVCPVCCAGTEIVSQNDVKTLYCTNPNCRAQLVKTITHYASRDALNIEGFSEQTVEKFVEAGFLANYADIYNLSAREAEIKEMHGFGARSYDKLAAAIEKSKAAGLANFMYGLGIPNVGLSGARLLCRWYKHDLAAIRAARENELLQIDGFGEVIARAVAHYFADASAMEILDAAVANLTFEVPEETDDSPIAGKTFVITGEVRLFENRAALQAFIEAKGGKAAGSVSAKTAYLINNDSTSASSKNKKAQALGVPIVTEEEFMELLGETR